MRGKHKQSSSGRARAALDAAIAAARAELHDEQHLLEEAEAQERALDARRAHAAQLTAIREHVTAAESEALAAEEEVLRLIVRRAEQHEQDLRGFWESSTQELIGHLGGGPDGFESFMELLTGRRPIVTLRDAPGLNAERTQQLEMARGERRMMHVPSSPAVTDRFLDATVAPGIGRAVDSDGVEQPRLSSEVAGAGWGTVDPDALTVWHPMPWLSDTMRSAPGAAGDLLGVTQPEPGAAVSPGELGPDWTPPTPALSATRRGVLASASAYQAVEGWGSILRRSGEAALRSRIVAPTRALPPHSTPADAAALRHWYVSGALGSWRRAEAYQRGPVERYGEVAVAAMAAPVFWMPPAQTFDFLDSEPLTDFDDLRLPYPQVLLTFAEPPVLPAFQESTDDDLEAKLAIVDAALLSRPPRKGDVAPMDLLATLSGFNNGEPLDVSVWDALRSRGARVECLLLLGDSLGRLDPLMAWGLAIPSRSGGEVIGRVLVPAEWARSAWRDQILNAAAVAAWADWHSPIDRAAPGAEHGSGGDPAAASLDPADEVRVLAVRATRVGERSSTGVGTGRTVAAHVRRGHWRRQHYGPRNTEVRRVRIAPTLVNAQQRSFAARVYVLPGASTGTDVSG